MQLIMVMTCPGVTVQKAIINYSFAHAKGVYFTMHIDDINAWEVLKVSSYKQIIRNDYQKIMWFHFNKKLWQNTDFKPLTNEQYALYRQNIQPILEKSGSKYKDLNINYLPT